MKKNLASFLVLSYTLLGIWGFISCEKKTVSAYPDYRRADLRMYEGAPPVIPHALRNRACLDCHAQGLMVEGKTAPVTPHPQLANCMQCHILQQNVTPFRENNFAREVRVTALPKANPSGPPLIPHRVFMRENCLVCHNDPTRKEVVQTTHPQRANCRQCHIAQNAEVELFRKNERMQDVFAIRTKRE
ncbi:MAG: nitrate reductase cytochrome c-type subunit [candidate division KSB1 bacterium]|nr:nitrate reductase cytochrome c-type subunit [candidate division KSB1 bacterium]MDZ7369218.1 nitrate reductase cytochrome c-type subunit [candidate division KSB1 bacterium]MDZ7407203.1 nitrate reductase cytochrome c-type subunit [candidate division KSB1 bacterium]